MTINIKKILQLKTQTEYVIILYSQYIKNNHHTDNELIIGKQTLNIFDLTLSDINSLLLKTIEDTNPNKKTISETNRKIKVLTVLIKNYEQNIKTQITM